MSLEIRKGRLLALLGIFTLGLTLSAGAAEIAARAELTGRWEGSLTVGENQLRIVLHVDSAEDGTLEATLDSPDQGAKGIPVTKVEVDGDTVRFEINVLGAVYAGQLTSEREAIEGKWQQSGHALPLKVERATDGRVGLGGSEGP